MHSHHTDEGAPTASTAPVTDLETARALLAEEEQRRMQECAAKIQALLAEYGMSLEVTPAQIVLSPTR